MFYFYMMSYKMLSYKYVYIELEISCYSGSHQVFKFYLVLKITKIHIKLTKAQKYFSASSLVFFQCMLSFLFKVLSNNLL